MPTAYIILTDAGKSSNTNIGNMLTAIKNYVDTKASPYKKPRGEWLRQKRYPRQDLVGYYEDSYQHEWQGKGRQNSRSWIS